MFGKNPVEKLILGQDGLSLHVVAGSPFYTIQGEGPNAGRPAVFLRLHGCPLRCYFCDTEFSAPTDPIVNTAKVISQIRDMPMPLLTRPLLVITGGEPLRQNLKPLIMAMTAADWEIQVETAGVFWQDCLYDYGVQIIVSPKTPTIHPRIAQWALAYKYVVRAGEIDSDGLPLTNTQDEHGKPLRLARPPQLDSPQLAASVRRRVYLSPMDEYNDVLNEANRFEVARQAMAHGYTAGLQLHKFFNLP